jgi:hypothetical protein
MVLHQNQDLLKPELRPFTIATRSQQLNFVKEAINRHNHRITGGKALEPDDPRNEELMKKEQCSWILNWVSKQKCRYVQLV